MNDMILIDTEKYQKVAVRPARPERCFTYVLFCFPTYMVRSGRQSDQTN